MYKRWIKIIFFFLLTAILSSGCEKKPILIGYSGNLTGTSSEIAVEGMYGTMMAISEVNESGGIKGREIRLIIEDDGNSDETAVEADQRLVEQGVTAIIGHSISGVAGLSVPYINSVEMIMISPTISSSAFAFSDDYFFTMVPISEHQSQKISKAIIDFGYSKTGYLYQIENERYSIGFVEDVINNQDEVSNDAVFITPYSQADDESFEDAAQQIKLSEIDSLVIAGSAYDVARFAQILYSRDIQLPIFTSTWSMSTDLLTIAGPAAEGIYTINTYDSESPADLFIEFYDGYVERYGEAPTFASVYAYEGTKLLMEALRDSTSFESKDIKSAIEENASFTGLQGDVYIDEFGDAHRDMFLFQVKNGEFVKVD